MHSLYAQIGYMKLNASIAAAFFYRMLFQKIDYDKVVFTSTHNNCFDYNTKYLFQYMRKHTDLNCLFVMNDEKRRGELVKEYGDCFINTKTFHGAVEAFSAGAWIVSAGLPVYIPYAAKRRFILNVGHGMPIKNSGLNSVEVNKYNRMFYKWIFSDNYSGVTCSSKFFGNIITDNFQIPKDKALCLGQARNDQLFNDNNRQKILDQYFHIGGLIDQDSKLVLYAPTFRDEGDIKFFPFEDMDLKSLHDFLEENNIFIFLRPHKNGEIDLQKFCGRNIYILSNSLVEDIMEIMNIFDILITDYSSIFLDYLVLERPILFLPYDLDAYTSIRGFVYDYDSHTPGEKPKSLKEFTEVLRDLKNGQDAYIEKRHTMNELFNEVKEGSCKLHSDVIVNELSKFKR